MPAVTESVSEKDGVITLTLNNLSESEAQTVEVSLADGCGLEVLEASIVTGARNERNTFDAPDTVTERPFEGHQAAEGGLTVTLPACSVVLLRLRERQ